MKLSLICLVVIFFSCTSTPTTFDKAAETEKILALHHQQRDVHFNKQADEFTDMLSENFISVNRGMITTPSKEENLERFSNYFNAVEFIKWDDLAPPIIRFSDDGSLAYTVVEKEVIVAYDMNEQTIQDTTLFAWIAIYKKYGNEWKIDGVASTNVE